MRLPALLTAILFSAIPLSAQTNCPATPAYSICDIAFDLSDAEAASHPNPYVTLQLHAEFRSPRHKTFLIPAFWDGGRRMVIRFAPAEAGEWDYNVTSNIARFDNKQGQLTATASEAPGFIHAANVHHWATENKQPHLWMGAAIPGLASLDRAAFDKIADACAQQKFNHVRIAILEGDASRAFPNSDRPNPDYFRQIDEHILALNRKGIVADLILASASRRLDELMPAWQQRERLIRYSVARYSAMNITWQAVEGFENYPNGRELLKELGSLLKKTDPYRHLISTHANTTSSPLLSDGWMDYLVYQSSDPQLGAIEHQLYQAPSVNVTTGKDGDVFRRALWNSTMNGQYPIMQGEAGLDSPNGKVMAAWFDFFSNTRYWELEPYFDVDGGRAIALEEVEYIVYVEKPGPVEVTVEKHGYNISWFNPQNGESIKMKDFKGEHFTGAPPDSTHDWVLHIAREGRKQSMLNSYKFESRHVPVQEVEQSSQKVPFQIVEPSRDEITVSQPTAYSIKLKKETRATRSMVYLWTGEVPAEGQGSRVLGVGSKGTFQIPRGLAKNFPAVLSLHVTALNANGKAYSVDKVYQLKP